MQFRNYLKESLVMAKANKNVLVIDDDHDIRDLVVFYLNNQGYLATGVSNGEEAITHLQSAAQTDLIILDLMMPVMDAWEFRQAQQQDPAIGKIPVVLISATDEVSYEVEPLAASGFIRKPIDFNHLLATVEQHC
jgi:CheY-like chemotaxis protein